MIEIEAGQRWVNDECAEVRIYRVCGDTAYFTAFRDSSEIGRKSSWSVHALAAALEKRGMRLEPMTVTSAGWEPPKRRRGSR